jgi:protein-tyrosine phosphatase
VMRRHGLDISGHRSAQLTMKDLERYDVVLAMDAANLNDIEALAERLKARGASPAEVVRFDAQADVPDPYYGGADGFEAVYAQVDAASAAWVNRWKQPND